MDYGFSPNGWRPLSSAPVAYDPESIPADLIAAGYTLHPTGSTNDGAVFYVDADSPEYPYVVDVTELSGVTTLVWAHDFVTLIKLGQELGSLKGLLGVGA